jgi:hypothetical protein
LLAVAVEDLVKAPTLLVVVLVLETTLHTVVALHLRTVLLNLFFIKVAAVLELMVMVGVVTLQMALAVKEVQAEQ